MTDFFDVKHSKELLIFLFERGPVNQEEIMRNVVKSNSTLYRLLDLGSMAGLLTYTYHTKEIKNKKIKEKIVTLTDKGKEEAIKFKRARDIENGIIVLTKSDYDEFLNRSKYMSILTHVNVLSDHIAIQELNYDKKGHDRVFFIYVKVNGNGMLRLWCEVDNSFSCWHVKYAWTLTDVQEMIQNQYSKGNIRKLDEH